MKKSKELQPSRLPRLHSKLTLSRETVLNLADQGTNVVAGASVPCAVSASACSTLPVLHHC